jgi:nucleotide-binding universal stress UspA family protein
MTNAADPIRYQRAALREKRKSSTGEMRALRILATVDGSERTGRVINYLLGLHALRAPLEVVLLNIQSEPEDWRLRGYGWFKREEIRDRLINDLGRPAVASAGRQLDSAGITHKDRIELGEAADTIIRCAREEDCDLIVLAEASPGVIRRWLMRAAGLSIGSLASVVIGFSHVPVVVAK